MARGTEERVEAMAREVASPLGLTVVDVELTRRGRQPVLKVILDRPGGVQLDECSRVSEELSRMLDIEDPIVGSYLLEVSSPGLDRVLRRDREFEYFRGRVIRVRTFAPVEGKREFQGVLLGLEEGRVELEMDGQRVLIPREQVAKAQLVPQI